jgi:hypothetical protein
MFDEIPEDPTVHAPDLAVEIDIDVGHANAPALATFAGVEDTDGPPAGCVPGRAPRIYGSLPEGVNDSRTGVKLDGVTPPATGVDWI